MSHLLISLPLLAVEELKVVKDLILVSFRTSSETKIAFMHISLRYLLPFISDRGS